MKRVLLLTGLILVASGITTELQHSSAAKESAPEAAVQAAAEAVSITCVKCHGSMEQGYILDVQGDATNSKAASLWVQGPAQSSFWSGVVTRGRDRRTIAAFRCTNCGYLELYAK